MTTQSWVIVSKASGDAMLETYSRAVIDRVDRGRYDVLTAYDYLAALNRRIKKGG